MKPSKIAVLVGALALCFTVSDAIAKCKHHRCGWWSTRFVHIVPTNPSLYINKVAVNGFVSIPYAAPERSKNLVLKSAPEYRGGWLKFEVKNYATGCEASVGIPFMKGYRGGIYTRTGTFPLMYHPGGCVDVSTVSVMKTHKGYVISVN